MIYQFLSIGPILKSSFNKIIHKIISDLRRFKGQFPKKQIYFLYDSGYFQSQLQKKSNLENIFF